MHTTKIVRSILVLALALALVLLWILWPAGETVQSARGSSDGERDSAHKAESGDIAPEVAEREAATPALGSDADASVPQAGILRYEDRESLEDGSLWIPRTGTEPASLEVRGGEFAVESPDAWRSFAPPDLWFFRADGQRFKPIAVQVLDEPAEHRVVVTLPRVVETQIMVQDFHGHPIAGAQVRVHLPAQVIEDRQGGVCVDERGLARVLHAAADGPVRVRVAASGYATKAVIAKENPTVVRLGRVLAGGYILDRAREPQTVRVSMAGTKGMINMPSLLDSRPLLDQLEARLTLSDTEYVSWAVLHEKDEWRDPPPYVLHLTDSNGETVDYDIPMMHILGGVEPVRPNLENCRPLTPVFVAILPESAFLANPPATVKLRFVPPGASLETPNSPFDSDSGREAQGHLVFGSEALYRFFVPEGEYGISASTGSYEQTFQRNPRILPATCSSIQHGSAASPAVVQLHPDDRYVTYCFVDRTGLTLDLAAELVPQRLREPDAFLSAGGWPRGRFIRPGTYEALIARNAPPWGLAKLDKPVSWPVPVTAEGCWKILVDVSQASLMVQDSELWQEP